MKRTHMLNTAHYDRIFEAYEFAWPIPFEHALGYEPVGDHRIKVLFDDREPFYFTFIEGLGEYEPKRPTTREEITKEYSHNVFAKKLRDMMNRRGFTQLMLAEKTGLSQGQISNYLRCNAAYDEDARKSFNTPSLDKIHLIAWALNCDPYELL